MSEMRGDTLAGDIAQPLAAEKIAAEVINDRKRVAVNAVAHAELPLEVDGPDLVGTGGAQGNRAWVLPALTASTVVNVAVAREDVADGAAGRPGALGIASSQALEDLAWSPAEAAVFIQDEVNDLSRGLMRDGAWCSASIQQPAGALMPVALEPLVPGIAADAVTQTKLA